MNTEEVTIESPELSEAKVVVNPYNFNNKLVNEKFVSHILKTYGLDFKPFDISLYQNAFVHKSYCHKKLLELEEGTEIVDKPEGALPLQENDNERLNFWEIVFLILLLLIICFIDFLMKMKDFTLELRIDWFVVKFWENLPKRWDFQNI